MKRGYVNTPHGQIHYQADGAGEPVIFLHQVPTASDEFSLVIPFMTRDYRAIAMDIIGYGNSDKPPRQYTMPEYAESVIDFIDGLDIKKASLVGHHTGAGIAAEVAARYPDRVDKLVVSGFPLFTLEELELRRKGPGPSFLRRTEPLLLKADGSHMIAAWEQTQRILAPAEMNLPSITNDETLESTHTIAMAILKSGPRNIEGHRALWHWEPQQSLPHIKCPTLILMTPEDQFYSRAEAIKNLIPRSKVVSIEGGGAYFPRQAPKVFAETVMAFLRNPGL